MASKKIADPMQQFSPIRIGPLGPLNAYTVHEHELDMIAAGSPAALAFNFAVALISLGVSFFLTLTTTKIVSDRLFYGYLIVCINCLLAGIITSAYWFRTRASVNATVAKIKSRLIIATPIQDQFPTDPVRPPSP